jgi:HD-GYP domain-containing protein (c-di-GMP phosphodiesterase class II)
VTVAAADQEARLAELMAALSVAVDLGVSGGTEHGQRAAVLAVRLAQAAGLSTAETHDAYYLALLKVVGCTGDHDFTVRVLGEDMGDWAPLASMGTPLEMLAAMASNVGRKRRGLARAGELLRALAALPELGRNIRIHCEMADLLSARLGLGSGVVQGLGQVFERWDGGGAPRKLRGEAIARPVRVAQLAGDIQLAAHKLGPGEVTALMQRRAGKGHDPALVQAFCRQAPDLLAALDTPSIWQAVLDAEPEPHARLGGERLDRALRAMGEFADMKSNFTRGHSAAVAALAEAAAGQLGLTQAEAQQVGRAGHLHDLGRVSVFGFVWDKPGPLSDAEWERVRMHTYYTERILSRLEGLGAVPAIAACAHERRDGSGYHRRLPGGAVPVAARLLARPTCTRRWSRRGRTVPRARRRRPPRNWNGSRPPGCWTSRRCRRCWRRRARRARAAGRSCLPD